MSVIVRGSERGAYLRCQARWWWGYREGLVPRSAGFDALWFGQGIHLALARWYEGPGTVRGPEPAETFTGFAEDAVAYVKTADATEEEVAQYTDASVLGVAMLEGYRALYGRDDHMQVIQAEQPFSMDVPWPKGQDLYDVAAGDIMGVYAGTYDLVWRDLRNDWLVLEEHKTAKAISTRHLSIDTQGGSYWATATRSLRARGLIGPKESLRGIEYNFLRKGEPDDRPRDAQGYATNKPAKADYIHEMGRDYGLTGKESLQTLVDMANNYGVKVLGERSKVQPPRLFERHMVHRTSNEQASQLRRIQSDMFTMQMSRDGTIPVSKNPTRDCGWDCKFYQMCELQERGGNWEDFKRLTYVARDPYADHRKSAEE